MIRRPNEGDLPHLREALEACGAFSAEEVAIAMEILESSLAGDDYLTFVYGDPAAGYVTVGRTPLTLATWHLYWLCVHPRQQRCGIGGALLRHAEQAVRATGGRNLVIETSGRADYEAQRRFYSRGGYAVVGQIPDFYKPADDCVICHKRLQP